MLPLSAEPFSFRYVSFQKGMQKATEFFALSRWGEVSVLVDNDASTCGRYRRRFGRHAWAVS
jgi:hypothetical protein